MTYHLGAHNADFLGNTFIWVRGDVAPAAVNTPNQVDYILKPEKMQCF